MPYVFLSENESDAEPKSSPDDLTRGRAPRISDSSARGARQVTSVSHVGGYEHHGIMDTQSVASPQGAAITRLQYPEPPDHAISQEKLEIWIFV